jgi:hypothetical protein
MPARMEGPARTRLVALVVLLVVALPLVIVAVAGSGGGDDDQEETSLRVERSTEASELVVFVTPDVNTPERTGGRRDVIVECLDPDGRVVARQDEPWPFTDTDQNTLDPHVHMPVNPARIDEVERCRVRDAEPPLEGPVA